MSASVFQTAPSSSRAGGGPSPFQAVVNTPRLRFHVELKEGELNVVSWKKLLKDAQKQPSPAMSEVPAGANPALEARMAPDRAGHAHSNGGAVQEPLPPPPNRFSSVIEKIERLYKGGDSDEDDGEVSPDDSQYDTEDDFIDDSELNEYFSVKNSKTKHTGFYVNRGKLEKMSDETDSPYVSDELPQPPPAHVPKKRKRRDLKEVVVERVVEPSAKKRVNTGLRLKDAARRSFSAHMVDVTAGSSTPQDRNPEQVSPKLKKRLKPISETSDTVIGRMVDSDTLREDKSEDLPHESRWKPAMNVVELSDDENDAAKMSKQNFDNDQKLIVQVPEKPPLKQKLVQLAGDEKNKKGSEKTILDDRQVKDAARESKSLALISKASSPVPKEPSPGKRAGWPKGTVLERAINDLEKGVAELCPFRGNNEERSRAIEIAEAQGVKSKRLPEDVKQKLAKVARLAARHGEIPDELIERLMMILGHIMRLRTLKRHLKAMVEMGASAKMAKDVRLRVLKEEFTELVKIRVTHQAATAPGTSDTSAVSGRYKWDQSTEDGVCDLYDQYVEGMDEHKGPQIRKLYVELAELWPEGWMDNHGIKNAVVRAKERKRKQNKLQIREEKRRRKEALTNEKKNDGSSAGRTLAKLPAATSSKEKLMVKSSTKQRILEASRRADYKPKRLEEEIHRRRVEDTRRFVLEDKRRGSESSQRIENRASKRVDSGGLGREYVSFSTVSMEKSSKARSEYGSRTSKSAEVALKRTFPRNVYEERAVEPVAKKRLKEDNLDRRLVANGIRALDQAQTANRNFPSSSFERIKKKKVKLSTEVYTSPRKSPSPATTASNAERPRNSLYSPFRRSVGDTSGRSGDLNRIKEGRFGEVMEEKFSERYERSGGSTVVLKEGIRWSSPSSRVLKD